ncbi:MAG: hypothetical protein ABSF60_05005 [Verrucomicrobiota bacterium]|jgi:hypothetical protein
MKNRWLFLASLSLVVFAGLVMAWQLLHYHARQDTTVYTSIVQSCIQAGQLARIPAIMGRDYRINFASGADRYLDLALPPNARVFMTDMTGPTNFSRIMYYYYMTYYLFPREVGTSLDHVTRITKDSLLGQTSESDQEILTNGFDVRIDIGSDAIMHPKALRELAIRNLANPAWFDSYFDLVIAFLLPLLTALAGMWLFRFLFSTLSEQMPLLEQLAYGLGLGMMAVAALTLGVKLCGCHGYRLVFLMTAAGAIGEMWQQRKAYWTGMIDGGRMLMGNPVGTAIWMTGSLVFLILFRLAGLQGLSEYDAVMAWMLKAKIIHLYTGREIVQWFSNPRLAHAHLDYPTLVPSLHAATFDSLGHVDEFVTRFWPAWMLLFLVGALASLNHTGKRWFHAPSFALLGLLLLPTIQRYVQWEGGTVPMIFFTVLGFVQCALWLMEKDRIRLGLGLTLLFGAAMAKLEGFIFLALVGSWLLLLPSARPSTEPSPRVWRVLAFCLLAALPFICLRVQIPALHYESGWAGYALHDPASLLSNWPGIFMILLARLFLSPDFANWSGDGGRLHWIGRWDGLSSLYNHSTLGLAWLCLWLTVALWFAIPARRRVIVWILAMLVGALAAFSGVFASFVSITTAQQATQVIGYTKDHIAGRYLLPVLVAWFITIITMLFRDPPSAASISDPDSLPSPTHQPQPDLTPAGRRRKTGLGDNALELT